ncbi:Trk K+ transport system, NAD-binding component [Lentibacillus halodurans]|uniref:Trk K+ transport system, NAD-binding component n=1 Tax=Lentibacillus halodurans TaxID=237679 RepID=A0A1I0Y4Z0_9BACI|nr:NAD-binding protein [Lentibacillus halodurans]SFB07640.1 Trk K+ transport system, NAD-binding component [Lentibacillus halodurans]
MKNHYIIVGWNQRSKQLISAITKRGEEVLLIDSTLDKPPQDIPDSIIIHGDASNKDTLLKADIQQAKSVVVTSESAIGEKESDHYSILITITIKAINPDIPIFTEILTKNQMENARRAGAYVIRLNELIGTLFFHELHSTKAEYTSLKKMLDQRYKSISVPDDLTGKTFKECQYALLDQKNLLVLGIDHGIDISINPTGSTTLNEGDLLITL